MELKLFSAVLALAVLSGGCVHNGAPAADSVPAAETAWDTGTERSALEQAVPPAQEEPVPENRTDVQEQTAPAVKNPSANPNQIPAAEIAGMAAQGADEKVIIDKILLSGSRYSLSEEEVFSLKEQGVTQAVIDTMLRE